MADENDNEVPPGLAAILAAESPDSKNRNKGLYANFFNYDEKKFRKYCNLGETKLTERQLMALWEDEEIDTPPLTLAEQIELAESYDFELDVTHENICHGIEISYPQKVFNKKTMADLTDEEKRKIRNTMLLDAYRFYEKYIPRHKDERKAQRDLEFNILFAPWFEARFMRNRYERIRKIGEEDIAAGNAVYATSSDSERESVESDEHVAGYESRDSIVTVIVTQPSQSSDGASSPRRTQSSTNVTPLRVALEENGVQTSPVASATPIRSQSTNSSQSSPAKQPSPARAAQTNQPSTSKQASSQNQQSPLKRSSEDSGDEPVTKRTRRSKNEKMASDQNSGNSSIGPALENVVPEMDTDGVYPVSQDHFAEENPRAWEYVDTYNIGYNQEEVTNVGEAEIATVDGQMDENEPDTDTESFSKNANESGNFTSTQK